MGERGFDEKLDGLVIKNMEMISIDARDTAVTVAHVFAQAHIGDGNEVWAFRLNGSQRFLNNTCFHIRAAGLFVFVLRNPEKQDSLQPEILSALRFIDNFLQGELENPWHARNRTALFQFFAYKKRENKIVGA